MGDIGRHEWRVSVELSGTLGEDRHLALVRDHRVSVTCIASIDTIVFWSAADSPAAALLQVLHFIADRPADVQVMKAEVTRSERWIAEQEPLSETELRMLSEQTG